MGRLADDEVPYRQQIWGRPGAEVAAMGVAAAVGTPAMMPPGRLRHLALFYAGPDEFVTGTLPFIGAGRRAGEPVLVAAPQDRLDRLAVALDGVGMDGGGSDAGVRLVDMTEAGRNPGRIIPTVLLPFVQRHSGRRVRIVGEPIWLGRTDLEYPACVQHEALINTVFAGWDVTILCPYDVLALRNSIIDDALATHPYVDSDGWVTSSNGYRDPLIVAAAGNQPLPDPPTGAVTTPVGLESLAAVRHFVQEHAYAAGLAADRRADAVVAVNELATNTVKYAAAAAGVLAVWIEDGHLVYQVSDNGFLTDPLAGRMMPESAHSAGGRGLVLVNVLADLVRIASAPGRTTVRVYFRR